MGFDAFPPTSQPAQELSMTYRDERNLNEPLVDRSPPPLRSGIEWGLPLGLTGAVIVLGLIFYSVRHEPAVTASHTAGATQTAPSAGKAAPPAQTQ
jgi:hypothetical protein